MNSPKPKIVIDTDCGVDDAAAILLALTSKEICEVLALTTCAGNTGLDNATENVKRVLTVCNEVNIPIHRGSVCPLMTNDFTPPDRTHGGDGLGNCASKYSTGGLVESEVPAAVALINLAKKNPGEVTVIAIGPLTNLALAHRLDPLFFSNLHSVVIMGGNYKGVGNTTSVAEFNFHCDPEAANIVLTEAKTNLMLVPWETTLEFGIPLDFYHQAVANQTKKTQFFKDITEILLRWSREKNRNSVVICDWFAVAAFLYPGCVSEVMNSVLAVECAGHLTKGLTVHAKDPGPSENKVKIVVGFDMDEVKAILLKMLL